MKKYAPQAAKSSMRSADKGLQFQLKGLEQTRWGESLQ